MLEFKKNKSMNKNYKHFTAILISLTILLGGISCEKTEYSDTKIVKNPSKSKGVFVSDYEIMQHLPTVKDGRLVFKNNEEYEIYKNWLLNNQGDSLKINRISRMLNFVSMYEIYQQGIEILSNTESVTCQFIEEHPAVFYAEEVGGSIIQDLQVPSVLSYMLNEFGIYQIGDEIIRLSNDYDYVINNGDESLIPLIINDEKGNLKNENIKVFSYNIKNTKDLYTQYDYRTSYFSGDKKRIVARLKRQIHYRSETQDSVVWFTAHTNAQKKIGIWIGAKLGKNTSVEVYTNQLPYYYYNNTQHILNYKRVVDTQTAVITFCEMPYREYLILHPFYNGSYVFTTHKGSNDDNSVECINYSDSFRAIH